MNFSKAKNRQIWSNKYAFDIPYIYKVSLYKIRINI